MQRSTRFILYRLCFSGDAQMSEFVEYLQELFQEFGDITIKRMFGGYGIYRHGTMFALVDDDTLYLKADKQTEGTFKQRDLPPFTYKKQGKTVSLSYYMAPEEALEDPGELSKWAEQAYSVAVRAGSTSSRNK